MSDSTGPRLIMRHKQGGSARIGFLLLDGRSVCGFAPLPLPRLGLAAGTAWGRRG